MTSNRVSQNAHVAEPMQAKTDTADAPAGRRVLMLVENNPYPQDARVRREARTLADAGYQVTVISPARPGQPWRETIDGVRAYRYPALPEASSAGRGPREPTRRPEIGAKTSTVAAIGSRQRPARSAESPRASCR